MAQRTGDAQWFWTTGDHRLIGVLFPLAAPAGIVLGILGVRDLKQHDHNRGCGRAITGIVLGGLVTLGWLVIIIVALLPRHGGPARERRFVRAARDCSGPTGGLCCPRCRRGAVV